MQAENLAFIPEMPLPDVFSGGQLFAFSGIAGENLHRQDFCGVLTGAPGEIRFTNGRDCPCRILLRFTEEDMPYDIVLSDLLAAKGGAVLVTFSDAETIVGRSDCVPAVRLEKEAYLPGARTLLDGQYAFTLAVQPCDGGFQFAFCRRKDADTAQEDAQKSLDSDADALAQSVLNWYCELPLCPDPRYQKLWYKCHAVNRVNLYSPQDGFERCFTVPDRLVHRDMRLWDSCFHALAMVHYAPSLAVDAVLSVLDCQREDGFIPQQMSSRTELSDILHPPVLCMTVWNLYEVTGDLSLLQRTVKKLRNYLQWILENRLSPSGLMAWHMQSAEAHSRCGESGMDDSPRFDTEEKLEAVDFSVWMAYELLCLRRIFMTLGDRVAMLRVEELQRTMVTRINARLWDEETGCYFDRTWDGEFRRVLTPVSFLPLFAFICDPRQARRLVQHLEPLMRCEMPIPSAADEAGGFFTRELWRGGVWLNYNYFIYLGLQRYGFGKLASELRQKTLKGVDKQFRATGNIFAFYDPLGGKEPQPEISDDPVPMRATTDFNPSASFMQLFLYG